jgi:hypothetical protein
MPVLTANGLLSLAELGVVQTDPIDRALLLLGAVYPGLPRPELEMMSLGRRDAALLRLYGDLFGSVLPAQTACQHCGAQVELELRVDDLLALERETQGSEHQVTFGAYQISFRLPASADLLAVRRGDPEAPPLLLLQSCVQSVHHDGHEVGYGELPAEILEQLETHMDEIDPLADIQLQITCLECGYSSTAPFDIASFLWIRIAAEARRLLRELDILARVYGWREADILALSPIRRRTYAEMAEAHLVKST